MTVVAEAKDFPAKVIAALSLGELNVIVPADVFAAQPEFAGGAVRLFSQAEDAAAFAAACEEIFAGLCGTARDYSVQNIEQSMRISNNLTMLVMIFVYGFIGMMTLVAVTSVISTISTGIHLRRQEFAMLLSVGMTAQSLKKMLAFESLLYGLKAIALGVPIGFLLYVWLYRALVTTVTFAFIWPKEGIAAAVISVLAITFLTMRYSSKKIARENIADALKDHNL